MARRVGVTAGRRAEMAAVRERRSGSLAGLTDDADSAREMPYYDVDLRPQGAIVRRTTRRYLSMAELAPSFRAIHEQLFGVSATTASLLIDLRAIVGRNDSDFEAVLAPLRRKLLLSFGRVALLVRSTIGRLQLERYLAADGIESRVFADEAEAMSWFVAGHDPPREPDTAKRGG